MRKSVLILGAGVAGLAAARALSAQDVSVVVLEAQPRLGGRIHTLYEDPYLIELGAEFVHGENQNLFETLRAGSLPVKKIERKRRLFEKGRMFDVDPWVRTDEILRRIDPAERDCSFEDFLRRQADLDEHDKFLMRHVVVDFNAAHSLRISAQALFQASRAAEQMHGANQFRVTAGYAALVRFLALELERHHGIVLTNSRARQVVWKPGSVEVWADRAKRRESFRADAALVTVPLGILKTGEITFHPSLPGKIEVAREIEFGNVVKVVFQFQETFWEDHGFIHAPETAFPTWWPDPRGPLITGWAGGPHADALLRYSQAQLEEIGLEILGKLFSQPKDSLRRFLVRSYYLNWAADPHIRGAYSYIPVNGLSLPQVLAESVGGTLFFAGEATVADAQTGTVFGALESGLRAAGEILEST